MYLASGASVHAVGLNIIANDLPAIIGTSDVASIEVQYQPASAKPSMWHYGCRAYPWQLSHAFIMLMLATDLLQP